MKVRILTLGFDPELGRFDDQSVREFLADKELVKLREHFFVHRGRPHLTLVLTYRAGNGSPPPRAAAVSHTRRETWRELLKPADMALFNTLREWRSQKAKADGVPPYVICTNRELAAVVCARPQSLSKLGEIEGFGSAKVKKYGAEMIAYLHPSADGKASASKQPEASKSGDDG